MWWPQAWAGAGATPEFVVCSLLAAAALFCATAGVCRLLDVGGPYTTHPAVVTVRHTAAATVTLRPPSRRPVAPLPAAPHVTVTGGPGPPAVSPPRAAPAPTPQGPPPSPAPSPAESPPVSSAPTTTAATSPPPSSDPAPSTAPEPTSAVPSSPDDTLTP